MEIILSKLTNPNEEQLKLIEKIREFDLYNFLYDPNNEALIAVVIITQNQMITLGSFIGKNNSEKPAYNLHYEIEKEIYRIIYPDVNDALIDSDTTMQNEIVSHGNILIELCPHSPSMIWLPGQITESQLQSLIIFNEALKKCIKQQESYFEERPLMFDIIYEDKIEFLSNNFDEIINSITLEGGKNEGIYGARESQKNKVRRIGRKRN